VSGPVRWTVVPGPAPPGRIVAARSARALAWTGPDGQLVWQRTAEAAPEQVEGTGGAASALALSPGGEALAWRAGRRVRVLRADLAGARTVAWGEATGPLAFWHGHLLVGARGHGDVAVVVAWSVETPSGRRRVVWRLLPGPVGPGWLGPGLSRRPTRAGRVWSRVAGARGQPPIPPPTAGGTGARPGPSRRRPARGPRPCRRAASGPGARPRGRHPICPPARRAPRVPWRAAPPGGPARSLQGSGPRSNARPRGWRASSGRRRPRKARTARRAASGAGRERWPLPPGGARTGPRRPGRGRAPRPTPRRRPPGRRGYAP